LRAALSKTQLRAKVSEQREAGLDHALAKAIESGGDWGCRGKGPFGPCFLVVEERIMGRSPHGPHLKTLRA